MVQMEVRPPVVVGRRRSLCTTDIGELQCAWVQAPNDPMCWPLLSTAKDLNRERMVKVKYVQIP